MMDEASKRLLEDLLGRVNSVGVAVARIEERTRFSADNGTPWAQRRIAELAARVTALEHLSETVQQQTTVLRELLAAENKRQGALKMVTWVAGLGFTGGGAGILALIYQLLGH